MNEEEATHGWLSTQGLSTLAVTAANFAFWCWSLTLMLNSPGWLQLNPGPYDQYRQPGSIGNLIDTFPLIMIPLSLIPLMLVRRGRDTALQFAVGILGFSLVWLIVVAATNFV